MNEISWALRSGWEWWKCKNVEYDELTQQQRFWINFVIFFLITAILLSSPWIGILLFISIMLGRFGYQYSILPSSYDGHHDCGGNCKCTKSDNKDDIDNVRG